MSGEVNPSKHSARSQKVVSPEVKPKIGSDFGKTKINNSFWLSRGILTGFTQHKSYYCVYHISYAFSWDLEQGLPIAHFIVFRHLFVVIDLKTFSQVKALI